MVFGQVQTDHMLIVNYDPVKGWGAPEIKPYGPLVLDPMASCFQYCPNVFEGMKAYVGPDGEPRLFRPQKNMERLARSAARVALPPFNPDALLTLIKRLVAIEKRWIPNKPGYSLYLRPTVIGTRPALGVTASDSACLYVVATPTGPYFKGKARAVSLLAVNENVRAWPGGTGGHKLGLNYAPGFLPQREAAKKGYDQILWLLEDRITEVGAMNVFVVVKRDDGDIDVFTPPLDGTILPGVTRSSVIELLNAHGSSAASLPGISQKTYVQERTITMPEIKSWSDAGRLLEIFGCGTAVVVAPVGRIGYSAWGDEEVVLPEHDGGHGPIGKAVCTRLTDIQTGKSQFDGWSVPVA
ncbi:branched-chain amino acid aminotransferase II [Coprinellus micaceus]|uniref:Branched-chain-amino-acid aminotransferase n=1 Tax=Coprinellus micaceus TaxID=71717 RepID=A0A4Y7T5N5_COPMI|nr:branched-chain amino acid aminotransferase II [Coprinellus micaceus]